MTDANIGAKIVLLLCKDPDSDLALHTSRILEEKSRLAQTLGARYRVQAAVLLEEEDARFLASAFAPDADADGDVTDVVSGPYSSALLLRGPAGDLDHLIAATAGLAARLAGAIDPRRCAGVAGTEEIYLSGEAPFMYLYTIHRRPDRDAEHFHDYWRLEHTKLMMRIPEFKYRQIHAARYASKLAIEASGLSDATIDGVVEGYADTCQGFLQFADSELEHGVADDEKLFHDVARATLGYYRVA